MKALSHAELAGDGGAAHAWILPRGSGVGQGLGTRMG
jgi:hypothetical protein